MKYLLIFGENVILRFPFLHNGHSLKMLFSLSISLWISIPLIISFPISCSFVLNSFEISVMIFSALWITLSSCSLKFDFRARIFSVSSSICLVRFSSIIIGEYFSRDSIKRIPRAVAWIERPSRYPLSNKVSTIDERVAFVPKFFFSRIVIREVGVKRFGGCVSFSTNFISSIFRLISWRNFCALHHY